MRQAHLLGALAFAALAHVALAQGGGWRVEATPFVSPAYPVAEIRVYAWFDHAPNLAELFAAGEFDLLATDPAFVDYSNPPGINGSDPPAPVLPTEIRRLSVAQLHFPPFIFGSRANPLLVVVAHWRPPEFSPRTVTFTARPRPTRAFEVYRSYAGTETGVISSPLAGEARVLRVGLCYADCDSSTGIGVLDIFDFLCFQNLFAAADPYACDCDTGTGPGACDIFDFLCFQTRFVVGCP